MASSRGKLFQSPSSADETASKRRRRSCTESSIPSGKSSRSEETVERFQSEWTSWKPKQISPTQFICLYDLDADIFLSASDVPVYVKKGGQNDTVLECSKFIKDESAFLPVNPRSLNKEQKKRLECVVACARIMLTGLLLCEEDEYDENEREDINKWKDHTSSYTERWQKSLETEREKLKARESNPVTDFLGEFYFALVNGFHNGDARDALFRCFDICKFVLGSAASAIVVKNLGGSSQGFGGNSTIGKVTHKFERSWKQADRVNQAKDILLNVKEVSENHTYVPDVTMLCLGEKRRYFLFIECKSFSESKSQAWHKGEQTNIVHSTGVRTKSQLWHQCLRGLLDYDCVYGCATNGFQAVLLKLEVTADKLKTTEFNFPFFRKERSAQGMCIGFVFDIVEFEIFIKSLIKIIQDRLE